MNNSGNGISENIEAGFKRLGLTLREIQILRHLALGKVDKQISIELMISVTPMQFLSDWLNAQQQEKLVA